MTGVRTTDGLTRRREFVDARAERRRNLILAAEGVLHRAAARVSRSRSSGERRHGRAREDRERVLAARRHGHGERSRRDTRPVMFERHLQPARRLQLGEQVDRGLIAARPARDSPAVPVRQARVDSLAGLEAPLLVGRAGELEEQRLADGRPDLAGRSEGRRGGGAPELRPGAVEEDDADAVDP